MQESVNNMKIVEKLLSQLFCHKISCVHLFRSILQNYHDSEHFFAKLLDKSCAQIFNNLGRVSGTRLVKTVNTQAKSHFK